MVLGGITEVMQDLGVVLSSIATIVGLVWGGYRLYIAYVSRRRLRVRILSETYDVKSEPNMSIDLSFEAENLGEIPTSLDPQIYIKALSGHDASPMKVDLEVKSTDRKLEPHHPKICSAYTVDTAEYPFTWFRRYYFPISKGRKAVIRILNASNVEIGFTKYWWGYFMYRVFGRLPNAA